MTERNRTQPDQKRLTRRNYLAGLGAGVTIPTSLHPGVEKHGRELNHQQTTITYLDRFDVTKQYATDFNETHDQIKVNANIQSPQEKYRGLIAQIEAGNAPDVVGLDVVQLAKFADLEALASLESFYNNLEYTDDIFKPLRQDFIRFNDTIYALPFWIDLSVYFYNKQHFEEAGLDPESPPKTWSEFRNAAKQLTTGDRKGVATTFKPKGLEMFFWMPHAWANGAQFLADDRSTTRIDEQPAVEALEYWVDLFNQGYTTDVTALNFTDIHNRFANEQASMLHSGGFAIGFVRENNPELFENLGVAMFPKPEGGTRTSFLGGNSIVIPQQTTQNDAKFEAAKEFVRWVNTDGGMSTTLDIGFFPARQAGFSLEQAQANQELFAPFKQALSQGHAPPRHPQYLEVTTPVHNAVMNALLGRAEPSEALSNAASEINSILGGG